MAKGIYTELFHYYSISRNNDTKNRRIRKVIRTRFAKEHSGKEWEDLTELEKQRFKLITMKDYLLQFSNYPETVSKKIDDELENTLFKANEAIVEHNNYIHILRKQFFEPSASEDEQRKAYELFCEMLHQYFPKEVPQTFEEWKNNPLTLYDIMMDSSNPSNPIYEPNDDYEPQYISQAQVDHVVLECVLKLLKDEFKYTIDVESIKHCLNMTLDIDSLNSDSMQTEIDPSSENTIEEQQKIIDTNQDIMKSIQKLDEHDFIIKE